MADAVRVDMFAVELGAALLLQFRTDTGAVRVLADAGEKRHKVSQRLPDAIKDFGDAGLEIHLMIGTHYDSDHLEGLVDVINDPKIKIHEAWLPPVANDTVAHSAQQEPTDADLLPLQLYRDSGKTVLRDYLQAKATACAEALRAADGGEGDDWPSGVRMAMQSIGRRAQAAADKTTITALMKDLRWHAKDAANILKKPGHGHADEQIRDPWALDEAEPSPLGLAVLRLAKPAAGANVNAQATIRESLAKDAINAKSLAAVVDALKKKKVDIRCATIPDGKPRRFRWNSADKRFEPFAGASASDLVLDLLGPSDGLVKKHWDRLPVGTYAAMALATALPIEPITPSNQLSYILTFEFRQQRILVSGDAGCVDFKPSTRQPYHPDLIAALAPLHVVQVAHHGGHNAHFYRCLLASEYRTLANVSYLLLSHKTDDKNRPSSVFSKFIAELRGKGADPRLMFTSRPQEPKVRDVKALIAPTKGTVANQGDLRLGYDGRQWSIGKHAVEVK